MKIECPHCGQHIELDGVELTEFSCPTCNGLIHLKVKAEAKKPPATRGSGKGVTLSVLFAVVGVSVLLTMIAGWLIWGRSNPEESLPLTQRIVGKWKYVEDDATMIYDFLHDGMWEHRIIPTVGGESPDSPELQMFYDNPFTGQYRVEGLIVLTRMQISNSQVNPFSEWKDSGISVSGDTLTKIISSEGKRKTVEYKKVTR